MKTFKLKTEDLKTIFSVTKLALAKNDNKPVLQYIQLVIEGHSCVATALDGYRMHQVTVAWGSDLNDYISERIELLIQPFALPKAPLCTIKIGDEDEEGTRLVHFDFSISGLMQISPKMEYIKTEGLLPQKEPEYSIAFDRKYLIDALKSTAQNIVRFDFYGRLSGCVLRSTSDETLLVLPVKIRE